jgi:hypothetical protein
MLCANGVQDVKQPAASSSTWYTKKENFYSERSPEADNQLFCKRLQLVYLNQAPSPENMGKYLVTEL